MVTKRTAPPDPDLDLIDTVIEAHRQFVRDQAAARGTAPDPAVLAALDQQRADLRRDYLATRGGPS